MASPLQFHGGFQVTGNPSGTSALLRFNSKSFQTIVDTPLTNHVTIQFGGQNLAFTGNYSVIAYDSTRMFLMF